MRKIRSGDYTNLNIKEVGTQVESYNRFSSTFLDGNIKTDFDTETTSSTSYTDVPDTTLTIDISRPSRVALFAYVTGGGNGELVLATMTSQLRIDSTGYGTEMSATTLSVQDGSGSSGYVLTLKPGKYEFGLQFKASSATYGARIADRQIMYFIFKNDYTQE